MAESFISSPEAPLGRGNNDDRRQWRMKGGVVGAAASRMRGPHQGPKQTLGAATRVPYHKRGLRNPPAPMKKPLV